MDAEAEHDSITLEITPQGGMVPKNQVTDYITRGDALANYNIIQFFTNTYKSKIWRTETDNDEDQDHIKRGHPKHKRVPYKPDHPKASSVQRIIRGKGHNNLPNFIGASFPDPNDSESANLYCASMLMLLKPWHDIHELKKQDQTWVAAFEEFQSNASKEVPWYTRRNPLSAGNSLVNGKRWHNRRPNTYWRR